MLYNKRNPLPAAAEREMGIQFAAVDELVATSDYVCMLLPLFPETEQSLSREFFARMKPGAIFVSCGGSGVVDDEALAEAVASGHLYGAAVDTFTFEPIAPDSPLLPVARNPQANLILTPHTAAGAGASSAKANRNDRVDDYANLMRVLRGETLVGRLA